MTRKQRMAVVLIPLAILALISVPFIWQFWFVLAVLSATSFLSWLLVTTVRAAVNWVDYGYWDWDWRWAWLP